MSSLVRSDTESVELRSLRAKVTVFFSLLTSHSYLEFSTCDTPSSATNNSQEHPTTVQYAPRSLVGLEHRFQDVVLLVVTQRSIRLDLHLQPRGT